MKNFLKRLDPLLEVVSISEETERIEFIAFVSSSSSLCSACNERSNHRHSAYMRKVSDLPIEGRPVLIHVKSYKWFCDNNKCKKEVFTERLPWIAPYRRSTKRLENSLRDIAFSTNAVQAEKVCQRLGMPISHDSLLRLIYKTPLPKKESPFRWH